MPTYCTRHQHVSGPKTGGPVTNTPVELGPGKGCLRTPVGSQLIYWSLHAYLSVPLILVCCLGTVYTRVVQYRDKFVAQ